MRLRCCSFLDFAMFVNAKKSRIVLFGAGVIGQVTAPEIMRRHNVHSYIECYIDNDSEKWGTVISVCGREFPVYSPEYMYSCDRDTVILICVSRYADVINQLERMLCTAEMYCYIMPMMCIHNFCMQKSSGKAMLCEKPLIPKKIHYMWFGKREIPDKLQRCIESWKKYCPDYEIIRWDESNYDYRKTAYMKDAYEAGDYGFIPDYARLDILYHNGGIYMDTDVEVRKSLDLLLHQEAFCGVEKWQVVNFGGCSGAVKGQPMLKRFLDARRQIQFVDKDGKRNRATCGFYDTKIALQQGYSLDGTTQNINGMNIYAFDYFHPYDYMSGTTNCTENTFSIHWFNGGWMDEELKLANEKAADSFDRLYRLSLENHKKY